MAPDMNSPVRGSNRPLHGRGYTTSEGAFRVPTIMWWPGQVAAGSECGELATTMDLLPTFAAMTGAKVPQDRIIDGHDIAPLIMGQLDAKSPYDVFYYYERDQLQAVRSGPWKLFLPLSEFTKHPHFRKNQKATTLLFNVVDDIACEHNVADKHPDIVQRLLNAAETAREDLGDRGRPGKGQRERGKVDQPQPLTK